jgi:hydroxymethylglutaryl-CoA lyase
MDYPKRVLIREEGPREGFQFEKGPIATDSKIALIDALSDTGLKEIQIASFVHPEKVPGMADAEAIAARYRRREGVTYRGLWLNARGLERALATKRIDVRGHLSGVASEPFSKRNTGRTREEDIAAARAMAALYRRNGIPITTISVMAAFGCNFMGVVPHSNVIETIEDLLEIVDEFGGGIPTISLADTMAWANPASIRSLLGVVRERWPHHAPALHLHDTRGLAMANALAGLEMGVSRFDASVAGLGGCPFAKHSGAAGNICTEDLAFMCEELGIETGIDIEAVCEAGRLAETIVGHPLPGRLKQGGALARLRRERALV